MIAYQIFSQIPSDQTLTGMKDLTQRFKDFSIIIKMGNCCEPESLFLLQDQTKNIHHSHKYVAVSEQVHSSHAINKSNQTTNSKWHRDSISSAHPVNTISFTQSIRPPSLIESPEQMEKLNDSQRMSTIYNSNLKIINSTTVKWSSYSAKPSSFIGQSPQQ